jgi:hypothetical protein
METKNRKKAPGRYGEDDDEVSLPSHMPQYYDEEATAPTAALKSKRNSHQQEKPNEIWSERDRVKNEKPNYQQVWEHSDVDDGFSTGNSEKDYGGNEFFPVDQEQNYMTTPMHATEAAAARFIPIPPEDQRFPGAERVGGDDTSFTELSFGMDDLPPNNAPRDGGRPSSAQEFLVVATTVMDEPPPIFAEATPLGCITRRCFFIVTILLAVIIGVVIAAFMATRREPPIFVGDEGGPSPTPSPTGWPRDWTHFGQDFVGYSDDEGGSAVAISRNGLAVAVGSPGAYAGNTNDGMMKVYKYRTEGWDLQAVIEGQAIFDELGRSVALSDDGKIVAVGLPFVDPDDLTTNVTARAGKVQVYRINKQEGTDPMDGTSYVQIGSNIVGQAPDDQFGWSVDISGNGLTVVIGARQLCLVRVLRFDDAFNEWEVLGEGTGCFSNFSIDNISFGDSVSISNDGSVIAIGAPSFENKRGSVYVFRYNEDNGGIWEVLGQQLNGEASGDAFGSTLSLSDNGMVLAVGSPFNDGGEIPGAIPGGGTIDAEAGSCHIFEYNNSSQKWQQLGSVIVGEAIFDNFGTSVSLSADGSIVAIGASGSDDNGDDSGHVRVFQFDSDAEEWVQVGTDIIGPFAFAQSGTAVAISADGRFVTIGSPNQAFFDSSYDNVGSAQVYETSVIQKGDFPVTVLIQIGNYPEALRWYMERLDTTENSTVIAASFPERSYVVENETATETVWVVEGGVYRFMVERRPLHTETFNDDIDYALFLSNTTDKEQKVVSGSVNGNLTFSENSFVAKSWKAPPLDRSGSAFVTLVIDFDQRPGDVHWVLLTKELVLSNTTERLETEQAILGFGPEEAYGAELALSRLTVTIDVSSVLPGTEVMFIFSDSGRDGLCCEHDSGSYKMYNGTSAGKEEDLLFSGSAKEARRAVHSFAFF